MDSINDFLAQQSPQSVNHCFSGDTSVSEVLGFPIAANQFSTLQSIQSAESQSPVAERRGAREPQNYKTSERSCKKS